MGIIKNVAQKAINAAWHAARPAPVKKTVINKYRPSAAQHAHFKRSFAAAQNSNLVYGWDTNTTTINSFLQRELTTMRARSREQIRNNPFGKRFSTLLKSNIIGAEGPILQAQIFRDNGKPDTPANDAIEEAYIDWATFHADYEGKLTFKEMQDLAIACSASDGEYLFLKHFTGKYNYQLQLLDPEMLDSTRNQVEANGNVTLLGVEFNKRMHTPIRYWFRQTDIYGNYHVGNSYSIPADRIIHRFISEWPNQVRGIPWIAASLFRLKMADGYDEAAIAAARTGASNMGFFSTPTGDESIADIEDDDGNEIMEADPGTFRKLPSDTEFFKFDPRYPHEQYDPFIKRCLQGVSAGMDLSYAALSNDLEGVNFSSIRTGVLEDREIFKNYQSWHITGFLYKHVYLDLLKYAIPKGAITIGKGSPRPLSRPLSYYYSARYQARRWAWVDPQKDMAANAQAYALKITSLSSLIREKGNDPATIFQEIAAENSLLETLGLTVEVDDSKSESDLLNDDPDLQKALSSMGLRITAGKSLSTRTK